MRVFAAIIISIVLLLQPSAPRYAAPYGAGVACLPDAPCSLATAQSQGGDVWLLPGTYKGDITVTSSLRSVPGTRARIDGGVTITGAGVTLHELEITDTSWLARTAATQAQQNRYVNVAAQNVTIEGCYIHDLAGGVYAYNGAGGASAGLIARHNLFYKIGWQGHGHAVYLQNDNAGAKLIQNNVLVNQYGFGMHAYGSAGPSAQLQHITFDGNVQANNRALIGGGNALRDVRVTNNRLWKSVLEAGYGSPLNQDVNISGNWIAQARLQVMRVLTPTVALNRFAADSSTNVTLVLPQGTGTWDNNQYWHTPNSSPFDVNGVGFRTFPQWQAYTGWDATSIYTGTMPTSDWIDVQAWAAHRGRVAIYNWTNTATITIDLAPLGLTTGSAYRLINVQNVAQSQPFIAGAPVLVPMSGWTVAVPYGASAPLATFDSRFAVFIVEPL